jgi:alkanesulfonate monooxygenase SsuD/methylene tetrahydromethanopterin reductase-like flavin-dependent oxidoreductase (luciferase family)
MKMDLSHTMEPTTASTMRNYTPSVSHNIPNYLAAAGSQSTKVAAQYSDGLITYLKPEEAKDVLMRFDKAARASGRNP